MAVLFLACILYSLKECQVWNEGMNCEGHSFQDRYAFGFLFAIFLRDIHTLWTSTVISYYFICLKNILKKHSQALFPVSSWILL